MNFFSDVIIQFVLPTSPW